jgi:hypothetical protein
VELTEAEGGHGDVELDSAQGRGEGVVEAGMKKEGAWAVLFIGAWGGEGRRGGAHRQACHSGGDGALWW